MGWPDNGKSKRRRTLTIAASLPAAQRADFSRRCDSRIKCVAFAGGARLAGVQVLNRTIAERESGDGLRLLRPSASTRRA